MTRIFILTMLALVACGSSTKPVEPPPNDQPSATASASAAPSASAAAPMPAPPTATLSGKTLTLAYGGSSYDLSDTSVVSDKAGEASLQFNQPMDVGYNQIWLSATGVKKGAPAKIEGLGMSAAFVQIAKGKANTKNVSSSCSTKGTITYDDVPKVGGKAKGAVDVIITCSGVDELGGPIAIKGNFADVPVKK